MVDAILTGQTDSVEPDAPTLLPFSARALSWANARWYNPVSERWLEPDPSGLDADANPYRYCANDPVNETDPTGLAGHHWVPQ
jgi:hypothetical protein